MTRRPGPTPRQIEAAPHRPRYRREAMRTRAECSLLPVFQIMRMRRPEPVPYCTDEQAEALLRLLATLPPMRCRKRWRKGDDR